MDRETFDRILIEEGIDDASLRNDLWNTRPSNLSNEAKFRVTVRNFKKELPNLRVRKSLNDAMAREYGWDK